MVPETMMYDIEHDPLRANVIQAAVGEMRRHPTWLPARALKAVAHKSLKYRVCIAAHNDQQLLGLAQEVIHAKYIRK